MTRRFLAWLRGLWERHEADKAFTSGMIDMICCDPKDREAGQARFEAKIKQAESRPRKERSALLRAKLIMLRDSLIADRITSRTWPTPGTVEAAEFGPKEGRP